MDILQNTSNSEILGEPIPHVLGRDLPTSWHDKVFGTLYSWLTIPGVMGQAVPTAHLYIMLNNHGHPFDRLGEPTASSHGVYLVGHNGQFPFGVRHHLSIYTQGHFYHLSAPDLPVHISGQRSNNPLTGQAATVHLKHEDLSNHETEDYIRSYNSPKKKALEAYQMGHTDFTPEQILRLAEWIIQHMAPYSLLHANCQHFVVEMMVRVVVRFGNRSSFVGTAIQIANWDLRANGQEHINSKENGFIISPPKPSE